MGHIFMKWYLIFTTLIPIFCQSQINIEIDGKIINGTEAKFMSFSCGSFNDEVKINNLGEFHFKDSMNEPGMILFHTPSSNSWGVWVEEGGHISIILEEYPSGETERPKRLKIKEVSGPFYTRKAQAFTDRWNELANYFNKQKVSGVIDSIAKYFYPELEDFITNNPNVALSPYLITAYPIGHERSESLYKIISSDITPERRTNFEYYFKRENLLQTGFTIEDFSQETVTGEHFNLYSSNAKFILLQFWSSDCAPCRAENPDLIAVYNDFKNKGFEIVGISLDKKKGSWMTAVEKDRLPWVQVSDLKGWDNDLARKYYINAIPFNILIDSNKKILRTNLTPLALQIELKRRLP